MAAITNQAQGTTNDTRCGRSPDRATAADRRSPSPQTPDDGTVVFDFSDRTYRIRGLERNTSPMQLKVNILASRDDLAHLDVLDLAKARSRQSFIKATAAELYVDEPVIKKDVGTLLLQLEQLRASRIEAALTAQNAKVELTAAEKRAATKFLRDPNLIDRILADYDTCGLVGEATNKLVCYLACVSRRLDQPLAVLIQSGSAAGKTSLMIDVHVTQRAQHAKKSRSMIRFTQRELREAFGWGDFQLRRHLVRLVELEYVLAYRTGLGNQRQYELLYDGQGRDGEPFLLGLTDVAKLRKGSKSPRKR